ncbi:DUF2746 domain-containing protein [Mycetocola reblochoni]|uniref:Uncharacterized protein n=2 Tax=Mycetocola reblochoni TaxID=331618 RepID=A0A1R4IXW2_9MICO|nr:DUF2746 domain-containing protein [Mycetocola reblochoni]RLP70962.1 DUF2746 domain-containing protein [Mycetocola reblochoni]SJN24153.1 hypothetical protein FM119_04045 [Mycetocola reblochoni REB411]
MSENVIVALIAAVQAIMLAMLGRAATQQRRTREAITNSHSTHIRDDLDELAAQVRDQGKDIGGIRSDIRTLNRHLLSKGKS